QVLLSYLLHMVFLIFLVLRLETRINWAWPLIFTPLFAFDLAGLIIAITMTLRQCCCSDRPVSQLRLLLCRSPGFITLLCKLAGELTLSLFAQGLLPDGASLYAVLAPFFCLLSVAIADLLARLVFIYQEVAPQSV
ncbi:hypothetical protein BOX15_Mlig015801g1, partial [Macrostomum lignano]